MDKLVIDTENKVISYKQNYEVLPLVKETDKILRTVIPKYNFNDPIKTDKLIGDLIESLKYYKGYGLAAPQVGLLENLFIIGDGNEYFSFFNSEIFWYSDEKSILDEGCLSFPGLVIKIQRSKSIKIKYQNANGNEQIQEFSGLTARIIQHEYDHIQGITFQQIAKPVALKLSLKKREKQLKKLVKQMAIQKIIENGIK